MAGAPTIEVGRALMEYDLLIRGGRVVDGSGLPAYQADVGLRDGRVAAIGRVRGGAARTLDGGGLVGHIAVRHAVLGEEAVGRAATPAEIARMQALVGAALDAGALGLSTNRNERHMREDGKPVASRLADDAELFALCDVLAEANAGVIETINGLNRLEHLAWYDALARRTGRPIIWQNIQHRWS